ncbi:phage tail tape measure protein [Gordonia rubripertincta]|uniref:phage tail tape measure protein n=1 Tax=Gordonia rubripertincta TaxID=36822 RepID=UPI0015F99415|nr:phage tail tape measure protein [Gordonia rubripertincta]QMU22892.1 phage tail tape measure protein [Gordonia rubripertincta]
MALNVGELSARIGIEGLQAFRDDLRRAGGEFQDFSRSAERTGDTTRNAFQGATRGLDDLSAAGRQAAGDIDRAGRDMSGSIEQVERDSRRAGNDIARNLGEAGRQGGQELGQGIRDGIDTGTAGAGEAGQEGGTAFVGGFGAIVSRLGSAAGPIGAALAASVGFGAMFADQVFAGFEAQAAKGQIKAQFGWSEAQAAEAGAAASGAYVNAWGESQTANLAAAGVAIQAGLLDGNATAAEMQPIIEQLSIVSTLMGEEIPEVARTAGQMVRTGMADNITEAFDLLTVGQQKGLNLSGDLLDTMNEYGVQFEKLGIDGETALGTIAQMTKAGARDTDLAADALKEFSIRAIDGSEATKGAFEALNLNADDTAAAFAKGGDSALGMSRVVLTALAKIEDPVKRNAIGTALLGTQWEDLGPAIEGLNLSKAAKEMEGFGGSTKRAGDDMSGAAGGIEGMKRSVEVAVSEMQSGLADAFGPSVQKLANWVSEHSEEITQFFADLGKFLGVAASQTVGFTGAMITGLGYVVKYLGDAGGFILGTFADIMGGIGNMVKAIPGMEGIGQTLIEGAETADGMAEKMYGAGDGMIEFGRKVREAGAEIAALAAQIGELPPGKVIAVNAPGGQEVLSMLKEMGAKVHVDNQKNIVVDAPLAPDVIDKLEKIGIAVRTDNNKTVLVVAETEGAQTQLDTFISNNSNRRIINVKALVQPLMDPNYTPAPSAQFPAGFPQSWSNPRGPGYATGGWTGPGSKYQPAGVVHADEFVVRKESRQAIESQYPGALDFMNQFGKLPGYAAGGRVLDSLVAIQRQVAPALQLTSGVRSEPGSFHNTGEAGDFSNGSGNTPEMLAFAQYMARNYGAALAELIHHNPAFSGQQIDEGKIVPDSFFAGAGDHTNHVHLAAHQPLPLPNAGGAAPTGAGGVQDIVLTNESPREDVARKIIAEGRKRGYTDEQIVDILATGIGESNLAMQNNPAGWNGYFQQDSSYPGRDNPNTNITGFYDRLDAKVHSPGASDDMRKNIFWLQQRPGESSADAAFANGRQAYMSEMTAHEGEAAALMARLGQTVGGVAQPGTPGAAGTPGYSADTSGDTSSSRGTPPEDPYTTTLTFTNPLEPWWWKGEKEYRQRIIDDYEKRKAWDEYWSGDKSGETSKGKKVTVKSIDEATKDLEDAKTDLAITLQRQREQKPDSPQSSKMSMQKSVDDARDKVAEAEAALKLARENPQGFYYQPEAGQTGVPAGLPGPAKPFADGGWTGPGDRNDPAGVVHADEFVVKKDSRRSIESQYPGALDYMNAFGRLPGYADGGTVSGFGGYVHDESDVMAPKNWRDWMGLATGAGFAAYNLFEPYVNAAVTGKVDLGNITPQLNTGTTDTGMVTSTLSAVAGQVSDQLDEIIIALKEKQKIIVNIEGLQDPFDTAVMASRRV